MVLVLRLVVLVVVVIWRLCWRSKRPRSSGELDGRPLFVVLKRKPKSKELEGFRLGVEFPAPVLLSMHREQPSDRWFKALGLSREIQTGDEAFDCLVYVACDHGGVHELLQHSARLRAAIRAVFEAGFQSVRHDGLALWIDRTSRAEPSDEDKALLTRLAHELRDLDRWLAMRRAPFRWRAIGCEGLAWGLVGFGVTCFPFAMLSLQASLATGTLLLLGLGGALAGFLVCEGAVVALLRGSSRALRTDRVLGALRTVAARRWSPDDRRRQREARDRDACHRPAHRARSRATNDGHGKATQDRAPIHAQ